MREKFSIILGKAQIFPKFLPLLNTEGAKTMFPENTSAHVYTPVGRGRPTVGDVMSNRISIANTFL